tara:strand:- start:111 stop:731 length:621 start_codon:yes stop_codon:yes gene_type:complete
MSSKPKIWTHIAWDDNEFGRRCMGRAYNDCLNQHDDNDWLAIIDHDAMFCCYDWYLQLQQAIIDNPKAKAFTCRVNRLASLRQMLVGVDPHNHDLSYHRRIGTRLAKAQWGKTTLHNREKEIGHFSGTFLCVHVGTIKNLGGFPVTNSTLGQDNQIHEQIINAGHEFRVVDGIYVYHWYKADDPYKETQKAIDILEDEHFNGLQLP